MNKASVEGPFNQSRASIKNLAGISQPLRINDLSKQQRAQFKPFRSDQGQRLMSQSKMAQTTSFQLKDGAQGWGLPLREAAIQVSDRMRSTRARTGHAGANNPQPKPSVTLNDQHRLARPFPLGLEQRQAELVRDLCTARFRSQPGQHRMDLSNGKEGGLLGLRHQDHPVEPCHFHQEIFDRSQQRREREGQTDSSVS